MKHEYITHKVLPLSWIEHGWIISDFLTALVNTRVISDFDWTIYSACKPDEHFQVFIDAREPK